MPADQPDLAAAVTYCREFSDTHGLRSDTIGRLAGHLATVLDALDRLRQPAPDDDALDAAARELIAARAKASPGPWFINERTGDICHGDPADDRDNYPIDLPTDDDFFMCAGNHAAAIAQGYLDLRAALRAIANMAHLAWTDPATVKAMFQQIEQTAKAALESTT